MHGGEAPNAARLVQRILGERNLTRAQGLSASAPLNEYARGYAAGYAAACEKMLSEWRQMRTHCLDPYDLSKREEGFVGSIGRWPTLTPKQRRRVSEGGIPLIDFANQKRWAARRIEIRKSYVKWRPINNRGAVVAAVAFVGGWTVNNVPVRAIDISPSGTGGKPIGRIRREDLSAARSIFGISESGENRAITRTFDERTNRQHVPGAALFFGKGYVARTGHPQPGTLADVALHEIAHRLQLDDIDVGTLTDASITWTMQ
jgi:hypothetical protein